MKNVSKEKIVSDIVKEIDEVVDYDTANEVIKHNIEGVDFKVSKKTIENIAKWSLNGSSKTDIIKNLELTQKEFKVICSACPSIVWAMQKGQQLAEVMLVGSAYDFAIGSKYITEEKLVMIKDYEEGRVVGEHPEKVKLKRQLPPNADLLKFLLEKKLADNFGKEPSSSNDMQKKIVNSFTAEQLAEVEKAISIEESNK